MVGQERRWARDGTGPVAATPRLPCSALVLARSLPAGSDWRVSARWGGG
jgi:hypothetical protein